MTSSAGGGTAGIAVSTRSAAIIIHSDYRPWAHLKARLAEDPTLQIGVIEAGTLHADDPLVDIPCE